LSPFSTLSTRPAVDLEICCTRRRKASQTKLRRLGLTSAKEDQAQTQAAVQTAAPFSIGVPMRCAGRPGEVKAKAGKSSASSPRLVVVIILGWRQNPAIGLKERQDIFVFVAAMHAANILIEAVSGFLRRQLGRGNIA
jgi:hypothetical protein